MKTMLYAGTALLSALMMQMPAKPPMKMGLWETEVTTKMNMPNMPAGMPGMGARTTKIKSCMTEASYQKYLGYSAQQKDCTRSNEVWKPGGYSFDMSCRNGQMTGHFAMTFDSPELAHGTTHMTMNSGSNGMTMDSTSTTRFLSSDCGSITPEKPEIGR